MVFDRGSIAISGAISILGAESDLDIEVITDPVVLLSSQPCPGDVVILDIHDGRTDLFIGGARSRPWLINVLVFAPMFIPAELSDLVRAGMRGCVSWSDPPTTLIRATRVVGAEGLFLPPDLIAEALVPQPRVDPVPPPVAPHAADDLLTSRESEVLTLISAGLTHKQVARQLGLSKSTVDTYVQRVRQKLNIGNKAELTMAAFRLGLQHAVALPSE